MSCKKTNYSTIIKKMGFLNNSFSINLLDAINSWLLVIEVEKTIGKTAASSFKHTSPAGVAISNGQISDIEKKIYEEIIRKEIIHPIKHLTILLETS